MNKTTPLFRFICAFLFALLSESAWPGNGLPDTVIKALKSADIPASAVAVVVQDVDHDKPRLSVNADVAMNPASTLKLLTTFAAMDLLGPAFTWKTTVWSAAPLADGTLAGDLYLRGSADPKLTFEQLWLLLRQLRAQGVRQIAGDLVLDRSLLAMEPHDPAAFDGKPLRPYNVGPDALLLNFKAIRLTLRANASLSRPQVLAEPEPSNLDIVNELQAGKGHCPEDWREHLAADLTERSGRWRLVLSGTYPAGCEEKFWRISVMPHQDYIAGIFGALWSELGGSWQGRVRDGAVPNEARQLAAIESPTLAETVRDINKYSNNVMARQLFLTLAVNAGYLPANTGNATNVIREWMAVQGFDFPELVLDNGSGLSRQERISAHNMTRLLMSIWRSPLMPEMLASLPVSAVDGTMKKRLNGEGSAKRAHIKTGTLEGVKTLAGYILDRRGRMQCVVFFVNHANARSAQAAQDALLDWVYQAR